MSRTPIAYFADLHMHEHEAFATDRDGFNSRLLDCADAALAVARHAKKIGAKSVLFGGDWFHSRRKISVPVLHISEATLKAIRAMGLDVYALLGNHDLSLDGRANSIFGQPFTNVFSQPDVYEIDGWKVGIIPWTDNPDDVAKVLRKKADFYAGHFGVEGARVGPSDFEMPGHIDEKTLKLTNNPVLLGHYHKPQAIEGTSAMYVGSPLQLSWGEAGENKRFLVVSAGSRTVRVSSVDLPEFPRFERVAEADLDKCRPQDFVEVIVRRAEDVKRARNKVRLTRGEAGANIVVLEDGGDEAPRVDLSGLNVRDQLRRYLKHAGVPKGMDREELLKLGLELVEHSA